MSGCSTWFAKASTSTRPHDGLSRGFQPVNFRHVFAGGVHYRVADAAWADPLDASYSARTGARWNAPGSFGVLYLSTTLGVARANVRRLFHGQPYGPEDLDPSTAPVLIDVDLQEDDYVDVVTPEGIAAAGLPATYPLAADGGTVPHTTCQPVGQEAYLAGVRGLSASQRLVALQKPSLRGSPYRTAAFPPGFAPGGSRTGTGTHRGNAYG